MQTMPRRFRTLSLVALPLSSLVGLVSAAEAMGLGALDEQRRRIDENAERVALFADPEVMRAMALAQVSALEGMKGPRGLVLGALAVACAFAFASAARLAGKGDVPREKLRRILSGSLLAAAFLRTAEGAMWAVVTQRMGRAAAPLVTRPELDKEAAALVVEAFPSLMVIVTGVHTAAVAGAFLLLSQYFRSEKVKQLVTLEDERLGHRRD